VDHPERDDSTLEMGDFMRAIHARIIQPGAKPVDDTMREVWGEVSKELNPCRW